MKFPQLPTELLKIKDDVIDAFYLNKTIPENINLLYAWLEDEGWDSFLSGPESLENIGFYVSLISDQLTESECRDYECLEDDEQLTDSIKITYTLNLLNNILENNDFLSIFSFQLSNTKLNKTVVIGAVIEMQGQLGPDVSWRGVYFNNKDFLKDLRNNKILVWQGDGLLNDEEILSLWT
ncbi:hypothetical protein [Polynucleobacter kasalickyi]|uniref:Uncharacterized protein n=1 Tax=Polynucleobacter kasalickyi TaxID=1938817 RepID=A0A1W2CDR7_9BURK|nr:hypothetical protein [Polynucleobacter kasalickyi]SMC83012.1 hypothetical protein SAMN06296008_12220 [Polynucleobacter kasalickyi]